MTQKTAIILGSVSFVLDQARVGINYIAEYLAHNGYRVYYFSSSSSIFDLFSRPRRARFRQAWLYGGRQVIKENLIEIIPRTIWPLNKAWHALIVNWAISLNKTIFTQDFDLMVASIGALNLFSAKVSARLKILRLQDSPHDFGLSSFLIRQIEHNIQSGLYAQIWAVSQQLCAYARSLGQGQKTTYLPNGVRLNHFLQCFHHSMAKKCIYVGSFDQWVDVALIIASAKLLPQWQFALYGPKLTTMNLPPNVSYYGAIAADSLPEILSHYAVGLIPFQDCRPVSVLEKPLKFFEYLATGLGIASVSHGSLKLGLGAWASYGNTPEEFAKAIEDAYIARKSRADVVDYLQEYDWALLLPRMMNLLEQKSTL